MYFKTRKLIVIKAMCSIMYHGMKIVIFIKVLYHFYIEADQVPPQNQRWRKLITNVTKSPILGLVGILDLPLYIKVDVVLIFKSFVFLKYILIYNSLLVLILSLSVANLLLYKIVNILDPKQTHKETVN